MRPRPSLILAVVVVVVAACAARDRGDAPDASDAPAPPDGRDPGADARGEAPDADPPAPDAATTPPVATFAYAATLLGGLVPYAMDSSSGALTPLTTAPYDPGGHLYAIARSAGGDLLYTVDADARLLLGFHVGDDGQLTPVRGSPVPTGAFPCTVAVDPLGRFVYVGDAGDQTLAVYAIDPASGQVHPVTDSPFALAGTPAFVAAERSGTFVYVSQQGSAGIRAYRIDPDAGAPIEMKGSPFGGDDVFGGALVLHPTGPFLYSSGGHLAAFRIEASGALTPVPGSPFAAGVGTDSFAIALAVDPAGAYAFAITDRVHGHAAAYHIDPVDGGLRATDQGPVATGPAPYAIAIDPGGRFVHLGNDDGGIVELAFTPATGALRAIDPPAPVGGLQPELVFVAR